MPSWRKWRYDLIATKEYESGAKRCSDADEERYDLIPPEVWIGLDDMSSVKTSALRYAVRKNKGVRSIISTLAVWANAAGATKHSALPALLLIDCLFLLCEQMAEEHVDDNWKDGSRLRRFAFIPGSGISNVQPAGLLRIAKVFAAGEKKYGANNWQKGFPWSVPYNHALRHMELFRSGDESEDHLAHRACNVIMLYVFHTTKPELCDIPALIPIVDPDRKATVAGDDKGSEVSTGVFSQIMDRVATKYAKTAYGAIDPVKTDAKKHALNLVQDVSKSIGLPVEPSWQKVPTCDGRWARYLCGCFDGTPQISMIYGVPYSVWLRCNEGFYWDYYGPLQPGEVPPVHVPDPRYEGGPRLVDFPDCLGRWELRNGGSNAIDGVYEVVKFRDRTTTNGSDIIHAVKDGEDYLFTGRIRKQIGSKFYGPLPEPEDVILPEPNAPGLWERREAGLGWKKVGELDS